MNPTPSQGRLAGAVCLAATAAAAPTILFGAFAVIAFPIGFVIALGHVLVLGLPAYLVLRPLSRFGWVAAALTGFIIGATPAGLIFLPQAGLSDGVWWTPVLAGLCGLLGALTFYAVIRAAPREPEFDPSIWE